MNKNVQLGGDGNYYEEITRDEAKALYMDYELVICCASNEVPYNNSGRYTELIRRCGEEDYRPLVEGVDEFDRMIFSVEKWFYKCPVRFWKESKNK